MLGVRGYKAKIVALLHDVVEDSEYTLEDLKKYFEVGTDEHIYLDLTIKEMSTIAFNLKALTEVGMSAESEILKELKAKTTIEELEQYDLGTRFNELVNVMKELLK